MALRARVDAMRASRPGPTRTAPPRLPDQFWTRGRYRSYVLFGATGFVLLAVGLLLLRVVWVLGTGDAAAWRELLFETYRHPLYLVFHALALLALVWFALRFFRVFPKTQPPRIGPFPRPPDAFFALALNGAFLVVNLLLVLVLWGAIL